MTTMRNSSRFHFKPVLEPVEKRALMSASTVSAAAFQQRPVISTQIGVGSPSGPFTINATKPQDLNIYVFSERIGNHAFRPFAEIARRGVVINGVKYHDVKVRRDPVDENKDGIPDAIITITPRSALDLSPGTTSLTVSGLMRPGTPFAHDAWSGTAPVTVVGGAGGGGGGTVQPFMAYVRIRFEGTPFVSFKIIATPGDPNGLNQTLNPGQTGSYFTAPGTGTHMFVVKFFSGFIVKDGKKVPTFNASPVKIGGPDQPSLRQYGLIESSAPIYTAVFTGGCCNYELVPRPR
jgi:hypothetical protein